MRIKRNQGGCSIRKRNLIAKAVRHPNSPFKKGVVPSAKVYTRKIKHPEHTQNDADSPGEGPHFICQKYLTKLFK